MRLIEATALAAALSMAATGIAQAQQVSDGVVKIGVLNDRSGFQSDLAGTGSEVAARIAAEEVGNTVLGMPVEIIGADMQNKPDVATSIARQWFDNDAVDAIADNQLSSAALAVQELANQRGKLNFNVSSASTAMSGKQCTSTGFKWSYDTYSASSSLAKTILEQGRKKWFFMTADYTFGHTLEEQSTAIIEANGGEVVGSARHPMGNTDFSSYLLTAQSAGPDIIALANGGTDTVNTVKQANEFGLTAGGKVAFAGLAMFITDVKAMGLEDAQNMLLLTSYYWDRDEDSRNFADKFLKETGRRPTQVHAGVYSAVRHYLRAVEAAGTDDGKVVAEKMREIPIEDLTIKGAKILPNGRVLHDMYLVRVKTPEESKGDWDLYEVVATVPGEEAFMTMEQSGCSY